MTEDPAPLGVLWPSLRSLLCLAHSCRSFSRVFQFHISCREVLPSARPLAAIMTQLTVSTHESSMHAYLTGEIGCGRWLQKEGAVVGENSSSARGDVTAGGESVVERKRHPRMSVVRFPLRRFRNDISDGEEGEGRAERSFGIRAFLSDVQSSSEIEDGEGGEVVRIEEEEDEGPQQQQERDAILCRPAEVIGDMMTHLPVLAVIPPGGPGGHPSKAATVRGVEVSLPVDALIHALTCLLQRCTSILRSEHDENGGDDDEDAQDGVDESPGSNRLCHSNHQRGDSVRFDIRHSCVTVSLCEPTTIDRKAMMIFRLRRLQHGSPFEAPTPVLGHPNHPHQLLVRTADSPQHTLVYRVGAVRTLWKLMRSATDLMESALQPRGVVTCGVAFHRDSRRLVFEVQTTLRRPSDDAADQNIFSGHCVIDDWGSGCVARARGGRCWCPSHDTVSTDAAVRRCHECGGFLVSSRKASLVLPVTFPATVFAAHVQGFLSGWVRFQPQAVCFIGFDTTYSVMHLIVRDVAQLVDTTVSVMMHGGSTTEG